MPVPTDITAGTISITGTTVTGVGTSWIASDIRQGDLFIWIEGGDGFWQPIVETVVSNTEITLAEPWEGPALTGAAYRLRYQWDSSRVSAQARQLIDLLDNGNVLALTGLTGPGVPVFDGPHSMTIKPEADFVNGVAYNVQVDTLADRAAYDGQSAGFAVLVSDVGDGRSAVYSKASNTAGDWTAPAYVTGPIGATPNVDATIANTPPGTAPTVTPVPITGGTRLDFTLPEAPGFYNAGPYSAILTYNENDVVRFNGSSFIALQAVPAGEAPSGASPPVDTAYWQLLASKGSDGAGTGDVVGPAGAIADRVVSFDGTSGKLIKDSGLAVASVIRGGLGATDNRLMRSDGTGGVTAQGSAATLDDSGNLSGLGNVSLSGSLSIAGLAGKVIRKTQYTLIDTLYETTSTTAVISVGTSFTPASTTSNLLVICAIDAETERAATGDHGMAMILYRYDGSAYVTTTHSMQQQFLMQGFAPAAGTSTHRGAVSATALLDNSDRRSDTNGWAVAPYFNSYYAGCTARLTKHSYVFVEFEP